MGYTIDYFIQKFEAIPEENWCTGDYTKGDKHCALGHTGDYSDDSLFNNTKETHALRSLFDKAPYFVSSINDGNDGFVINKFPQPTSKQRILAALKWLKSKND